jgi:hypothetical protein
MLISHGYLYAVEDSRYHLQMVICNNKNQLRVFLLCDQSGAAYVKIKCCLIKVYFWIVKLPAGLFQSISFHLREMRKKSKTRNGHNYGGNRKGRLLKCTSGYSLSMTLMSSSYMIYNDKFRTAFEQTRYKTSLTA